MHLGDYWSRVALHAGGSVLTSSYDITAVSSAYRLHSMRLTTAIMGNRFINELSEDERKIYRALALSHGAYLQVWQFAVDRHPGRTSSSYGTHQAWASFFQFGPSSQYDINVNLRAFMEQGTYNSFMAFYGFPMQVAKYAMQPYTNMMRGLQQSMQGYASKWDQREDPLRQWNYTNPRLLEAMQVLNPFSSRPYGDGKVFGFIPTGPFSRFAKKLNVFEGSLERRQLAGPDFYGGLGQGPSDIFLQRKGVYASARTGDANPGESFYDYRYNLQADATMAEYLYRARQEGRLAQDAIFLHDEATRKAALDNTTRRQVAIEAHSIRRHQEMYMFGAMKNPVLGYSNPLAFLWHIPIPLWPQQFTPRDIVSNLMQ
jgi:hypothetical protein